MSKNIKTQEAKLDLITKFLDYANVADASYAMLQYVFKGIIKYKDDNNELEEKVDTQKLGDKHNNQNSTYARAIQARFEQSKIIKIEPRYCISLVNTCFDSKEITLDNDISKVGLNDTLSKRTIDFVNRFRLLKHQSNTSSGFSATLFEDTKDNNQKIIVIRGTEPTSNFGIDILDADVDLASGKVPNNQYLDMIKFYSECVKEFPNITKNNGLIIIGHSLGGALAQLLTLSLANTNSCANVKEVYTFNSPGAKELKALDLNQIYKIDENIINSDDKEQALFYQIRSHKYKKSLEINLIGYDSNLFKSIKSYFHNKKSLKEHYIFIKTNIIHDMTTTSYFYNIFEIDEVFVNCINQLLDNLNNKNILATNNNTYHIETDNDPNTNTFAIKEVIQSLGVDIDGKHYIINIGNQFWDSHFLEPTINELNYILSLMKNKEIDNLLEYNEKRYSNDLINFLKQKKYNFFNPIGNLLFFYEFPQPSKGFFDSLNYLQHYSLPKEPQKPLFASDNKDFSFTQLQALEEYKTEKARYNRDLKEYEFHKINYEKENQIFYKRLQEYSIQNNSYQNKLYHFKKLENEIIINAIINQINKDDLSNLNFYSIIEFLKENNAHYRYVNFKEIRDLNLNDLNNKLGYFYCLYACINLIVLREDKNTYLTQTTAINNLGYSNDFTKIFILDKENLNDAYLDARKKLYKSINTLKEERNEKIKNIQDYLNKENSLQDNLNKENSLQDNLNKENSLQDNLNKENSLQDNLNKENSLQDNLNNQFNTQENDINLALEKVFSIEQFYDKNTNTIVLKTNNIKIIFLDKVNLQDLQSNANNTSFISMSNLIHIYDNHCDIFTKDRNVLDIKFIEEKYHIDFKSLDTKIFLNSTLLTGSTELPNNEFYFGELDKDNIIKQDKPSYYFSPKDESSGKGRLSIFYKNDELCLLNYSILEKSLNIKLECLSKKSLEYKDLISNSIKEQTLTQIDKKQAIAKLHALLENQNLECIHGGKVILKSSKGKSFKDNNIPIMLESDLLNSNIVGCPYTMGNVSYPCTKVVNVKGALTQKKVNGEYAILQELISACNTDKGFPLKVSFTPTKFKFDHSFDPKEGLIKQSENQTELKEPKLRMYYKEHKYQKDNLLITNLYLNNTLYQNEQGLDALELSKNDLLNLNDVNMLNILKQDFSKDYDFKECEIKLGVHLLKLIFVIPKNIAKVHKDAYKEFQNKDLGTGYFTELHEYNKDYRENENIIHHRVFLAPAKMQKIDFEIAKGLDEWLDNENVCSFNILTKDYFNTDDENAITNDNVKDDIKDTNSTKSNNANFNENNTQEIIPDNVIRIETQDGSGEFIEIVFDEFKEWEKSSSGVIKPLFSPLGGILNKARESLENVSIIGDALAILSAVKNPKNAKNIIKKKSKYATKKEVIDVLKNKYNLKTSKELGLGRSEN